MRRGSILGKLNNPNSQSAGGVWFLQEQFLSRKGNNWPKFTTNLYEFTQFTFTTAGTTGRSGPSLATLLGSYNTSANSWLNNTQFFNSSGGIQEWTVPSTGTYRITARGAQGGTNTDASGSQGGLGAVIQGDFSLTQGEKIKILVGQRLDMSRSCGSVGGGGGTFVIKSVTNPSNADILVIAGGGGGGGRIGTAYNGTGGTTTASGTASPNSPSGAGGVNGNGGGVPTTGCAGPEGAGGAGMFGNGAHASSSQGGGSSYVNGGLGGDGGAGPAGGFGGGGAANGNGYGGGGGGGYSGGGGGGLSGSCTCNIMGGGGGGGSYNNGTNQVNTSASHTGSGQVLIEKLS